MNGDLAILFRPDLGTEEELSDAKRWFTVATRRTECPTNSLIIGRYSVLPYYKELEDDLATKGCRLINSTEQFGWIADFDYYQELKSFTFETWTENEFHAAPEGKYVVKGRTNSRKAQWNKAMFAPNKKRALEIASFLYENDPLIAQQGLIFRKYVALKTEEIGINELPFTHEWRFFFLGEDMVDCGYYWSLAENREIRPSLNTHKFAREIASIASKRTNFFVADIGLTERGDHVLIELNDGQMSGLSCIESYNFYANLRTALKKF